MTKFGVFCIVCVLIFMSYAAYSINTSLGSGKKCADLGGVYITGKGMDAVCINKSAIIELEGK